jgi:pilus assembly protein FimV
MGGSVGKTFLSVCAAALVLTLGAPVASAAGLGKLTVISSLGQPFRGEIDLVAVKKEEQSSLNVRMASPDAFKQADLPFTAYVSNLKLSIEKRPSGDQYVKVTSFQPLNEPFIDFLVELSWNSGRLVRAYTALVDPPSVAKAPSAAPEAKPMPPVQAVEATPAPPPAPPASIEPQPAAEPQTAMLESPPPQGADVEPMPAEAQSQPQPSVAAGGIEVPEPGVQSGTMKAPASASSPTAGEYTVKSGDNLAKIAKANKPADVSLEQMLVTMFRENPDAFAGNNMNRLKTGKALRIPDASLADDVAVADARKEVRVQAANWNAYREKLAAVAAEAPAPAAAPSQSASGKVTSVTEDKSVPPAEAPKEVLKLSKGEAARTGAGADAKASADRVRSLEEEVAAKSKALGEANQRIASLEKTVKDMQTLMEMKSKGMSEVQKAAEAAKAAPSKPEPVKPEAPRAEPPKPEPPKAAATETPKAPAPVAAPAPAPEAPAPAAEAPKPPKRIAPPPPPPPAPSLVDQLLEDPLYLAGGAAALLGIGGLGFLAYKRRKGGASGGAEEKPAKKKGGKKNSSARLSPEETAPATSAAGATLDVAAQEEGDPLAEAEIFLTYGRDNLAEERLKEAIAANPKRFELHAKLLEIYAGRKSADAFEQVAKELQIGTGGKGEIWNKAARLGYQVDPSNPRYAAGRPGDDDGTATMVIGTGGLAAAAAAVAAPAALDAARTNLDFNLGFDESALGTTTDIDLGKLGPEIEAATTTRTDIDLSEMGEANAMTESVLLDPGAKLPDFESQSTVQMQAQEHTKPLEGGVGGGGLDFDFDVNALSSAPPAAPAAAPAGEDDGGLNFDLSGLDLGSGASDSGAGAAPDLDLSGINLDLGGASSSLSGGGGHDDKWYDVQTKFDLAKAYQEMGDKEGAREILQEVMAEGDAEQKQAAQQVLASLG